MGGQSATRHFTQIFLVARPPVLDAAELSERDETGKGKATELPSKLFEGQPGAPVSTVVKNSRGMPQERLSPGDVVLTNSLTTLSEARRSHKQLVTEVRVDAKTFCCLLCMGLRLHSLWRVHESLHLSVAQDFLQEWKLGAHEPVQGTMRSHMWHGEGLALEGRRPVGPVGCQVLDVVAEDLARVLISEHTEQL